MKKAVIDRDLKAAKEEALALRTVVGDGEMTDEQRSKADEIKAKVERLAADVVRVAYFDNLAARTETDGGDEPHDGATQDWQRQCRGFSLRTAIAMTAGLKHRADTGLEQEVSDEIERRSGLPFEGLAVPFEALAVRADWAGLDTRDVSTTTPAGGPGSRIVPTDYRPGDYIDLLRDALVTREAGTRVLQGLSGDVAIPKAQAGVSAGWAAENADLTTGDPTFAAQVTLSPNKVGAIGQFSARMILQASPDIEMLVRSDLAEGMARVIDQAVISGGGANEPDGVIETIANTARTGDTNGKALTMAEIYALELAVDTANVGMGQRAMLTDPSVRNWARQQLKTAGVAGYIYEAGQLLEIRTVVSNIVPLVTHGTAVNAHHLIYGNWSDCLLGYWGGIDLLANPYGSGYASGDVQVRIMTFADVAFRHEESFAYYDAITV